MPTLAQAAYLLKTVFLSNDQIVQFAEDTILWKLFKKDNRWISKVGAGQGSGTPAAYGMVWPIEDVRNGSVGAFLLSSPSLIPPGTRQGTQAYTNLKATSAGVLFDAILFDAASTDDQAFENVVTRNMKTIFDDVKNFDSRVMWGDGSGQLGTVGSNDSGTQITVSNTASGRFYPVTKFIQPGQYITFLTSSYAAISNQDGVQVVTVDDTAGTFTIASTSGINAGDLIFGYQSHTASSTAGNEPQGLRGVFGNNSTLYGIDPASHPKWIPGALLSGNTDPTEDFLEQFKALIAIGGATPNKIVTHPLVVSKYGAQLKTYKRYTNTTKIEGGITTSNDYQNLDGPEFVGVGPMIADSNTPMGTNGFFMWMGDTESVFLGEGKPLHWLDQDGTIFKFLIGSATIAAPSKAQYLAYLAHFWEMGCYRRKSGGIASDVNYLQAAS